MKKNKSIITTIVIVLGLVFYYYDSNFLSNELSRDASATHSEVYDAYKHRRSDTQVLGEGDVVKVLSDDLKGSKHQRFILKLPSGITILVAHNIDLAPRIPRLKEGDTVAFFGEYEWNDKGGVVHWTHHDPRGKHLNGWLKHKGNTYKQYLRAELGGVMLCTANPSVEIHWIVKTSDGNHTNNKPYSLRFRLKLAPKPSKRRFKR